MYKKNPHKLLKFYPYLNSGNNELDVSEASFLQEIFIRPGLWVTIINLLPERPIRLVYEKTMPVIDMGFIISGCIEKKMNGNCADKDMIFRAGMSGIKFSCLKTGKFVIPAKEEHKFLHLHMTLDFLRKMTGHNSMVLPIGLQNVLKEELDADFSYTSLMEPQVIIITHQILNAYKDSLLWRIYLEAKVLELLSLQLTAMNRGGLKTGSLRMNSFEQKQVLRARKLLIGDLHSPPTLCSLSVMTGLSKDKLQKGFREMFGKSVFEYFREYRIQTARILLEKAETNVSETAWQVGYVNVSHFSSAFKKRFGILPKHYQTSSLKNRLIREKTDPKLHCI